MSIRKGDVVEYPDYPVCDKGSQLRRFGIVIAAGPTLVIAEFSTGQHRIIAAADALVVHGYLHIDRPTREHF